jgi:pyroglutamyl-peptidase
VALRILVTGFEPFGGAARNPSGDAARDLDQRDVTTAGGRSGRIAARVLPVRWDVAAQGLAAAIADVAPHIVLCLGMAADTFRVEQLADDARVPLADEAGVVPSARPATRRIPTRLPVAAVERAIRAVVGPAWVSSSTDAGGFVCNEVFYALVSGYPTLLRAGFVHTPTHAVVPAEVPEARVGAAILAALAAIVDDVTGDELARVEGTC